MTSRSIVLGTAAVLLMSAATPLHIGFSPTAAYAQALTLEAAMAGNPSEFTAPQLRERIQVLRDAIQGGSLQGANRKAAQEKMKAYREVLQGIRAERKEARQDDGQAEEPRQGERTQRQVSEPAQQPAQKEERKAERQAQKDERQAQKDERQAEKAEREAQREAESQAQREAERQAGREAERQAQREAEQRQAERQAERQAGRQAERQEERQAQRQPEPEEVNRRAREITSDSRRAADLDNQALRQRLDQNREILGTDQLTRAQTQELRQQLRADREELRARVAARQEEQEEARAPERSGSDDRTPGSRDRPRDSGERYSDRDVVRLIEERRPSDQLTERELEERVRVLSRALNAGNITVRQAEVARLLVDRDREELRRRLYADRDHRRDRRRGGYHDNVVIEFEVGYRPPPVIYAAEAMPRDIQMQLVAPPMYQTQRAYTFQEIATNHEVREAMPGIEIDTLNFDFGSAEVRPEEIDKLDEIGMVIESIVAERPDEVFLIEGHTDAVGSDAANDALSQQRALAVVEALLDYFIIDPENLQTVGLGERYLKIQTLEAEEENRRVTVRRITPLLAGRG